MLTRLLTNPLTTNEMKLAAAELFQADEAHIAEVLLAMKARGETAEEMAGLARKSPADHRAAGRQFTAAFADPR